MERKIMKNPKKTNDSGSLRQAQGITLRVGHFDKLSAGL